MKTFTTLRVDKIGGHVAEIVLSRPKKLNAMNPAFFTESLEEAAQLVRADPDVRACLVRGDGRAFTAGLDLAVASGALGGNSDACQPLSNRQRS